MRVLGERDDRRAREDDGDDAEVLTLSGHVGARPADHLAADDALGVLDHDPSLAALHEHDGGDDRDHERHQEEGGETELAACASGRTCRDGAREADDDAGEDDQRHAVADAAFGDLLAQPHDEGVPVVMVRVATSAGSPSRAT
jgi:hypothetical protein